MRDKFPKADVRIISLIVAAVLLLGSIPLDAGVIVTLGSGRPQLTADICQQPATMDRVADGLLARPAIAIPEFVLPLSGWVMPPVASRLIDHRTAPDTPPPKQTV
jgi:hypothetical protein